MCDKVTIGDFVYIGRGTTIRTPEFSVGDYTRINEASYGGGRKPLRIGRNVYLGRGVYLDSNGGLTLEDNTLAGAYSQLWTHIEGGDMVHGVNARWHAERELVIEQDAWLVGRVVISHAERIGARSLVLNESNVLHDIPADTTWAGNPAKDLTDKLGRQFDNIDNVTRVDLMHLEIDRFEKLHPEHAGKLWATDSLASSVVRVNKEHTLFYVRERTYTKRRTAAEVAFLRFTSGKFTPVGEE
jgi:acetyltransferase-like isoleucine patch superfamily enzyme